MLNSYHLVPIHPQKNYIGGIKGFQWISNPLKIIHTEEKSPVLGEQKAHQL